MKIHLRKTVIACGIALTAMPTILMGATSSFEYRFRHADVVVIATVCALDAFLTTNEFGDPLIMTRATLCPDKNKSVFKGDPKARYVLEIEGGTYNGTTLEVSDLPLLSTQEPHALFLLKQDSLGVYHLLSDGLGYFSIDDATNRATDYLYTLTVSLTTVRNLGKRVQ